jgi:hypothetical protein
MANPVNFPALAALRPGEASDAISAAMGGRWRPPAPHDAGWVKAITHTGGFVARLDATGHIAYVRFSPPFPTDVAIAGLKLGMSQAAALAVVPRLKLGDRSPIAAASRYFADVSSHYRMVAEFHGDELHSVWFFEGDDKVYPPKRPMVYPAAAGAPGAPFRDPNLKLAVLSALIWADAIDLAEPQDLADAVLPRHLDLGREGYHLIREAYDYLVRYPLKDADLERVEEITFDGGEPIYRYCYYYWSGSTGDFDIKSVEGIARCVNLRRFTYVATLDAVDVDHLVGLDKLEDISLPEKCLHPERLLDLPALKRLSFRAGTISDPLLIARLKARGVAVSLDP